MVLVRFQRGRISPDLDLQLDRTGLDEITALLRGQAGGVHGVLSSRVHLAGPINNIGVTGRLSIEDVHRWDLLPPQGQGWPLDIGGKLDLISQQVELQSNSGRGAPLPVWIRFRAADYLSRPRWAVAVNWNQFPVEPIMELARHMGAQVPPRLKLNGTMDGAVSYSDQGLQGEVAFRDAALTIPDSPPVGFEQANIVFSPGHARLAPALVRTADQEQAQLEADYDMNAQRLDLAISSRSMRVASLRAQVALAAVPWLEQLHSGTWSGSLQYHVEFGDRLRNPQTAGISNPVSAFGAAGWTGRLELRDASIAVPGFADPLELTSARAQIDGARLTVDRMEGSAGKLAFTGEYRYEPGAARPHRVRLRATEVAAADLEAEFMPTLRRAGLMRPPARERPRAPPVGCHAPGTRCSPGEGRRGRPGRQSRGEPARRPPLLQPGGQDEGVELVRRESRCGREARDRRDRRPTAGESHLRRRVHRLRNGFRRRSSMENDDRQLQPGVVAGSSPPALHRPEFPGRRRHLHRARRHPGRWPPGHPSEQRRPRTPHDRHPRQP
ncbi:MAG: hypothetical protein LAQ30_21665 [Acidobacteriia bacterium]|nr:hypothetical protein [Terriglobia bacterium]